MKLLFIVIGIFLPLISFSEEKILISYFEPFDGEEKNHTKDVALILRELPILKQEGLKVILCPLGGEKGLNVSFHSNRDDLRTIEGENQKLKGVESSAFNQTLKCMEKHPDAKTIYSLGEGSCRVKYETIAYNLMSGSPVDNNENSFPETHKIIKEGKASLNIDSNNNQLAYCLASEIDANFTKISTIGYDPGDFVCNNLSYLIANYIEKNKLKINYEFVHIPVHQSRGSSWFCQDLGFQDDVSLSNEVAQNISKFIVFKNIIISQKKEKKRKCSKENSGSEVLKLNNAFNKILESRVIQSECFKEVNEVRTRYSENAVESVERAR